MTEIRVTGWTPPRRHRCASVEVFRARNLLVRQRTQLINALRGHLTDYGWVAPKGPSHVAMLADLLAELDGRIAELDKQIARRAREDGRFLYA